MFTFHFLYSGIICVYLVSDVYKGKQAHLMAFGKSHRLIGEMHMYMENFSEALVHVEIFLQMAKKTNNRVEEQRAYATIGRVHLVHGQSLPSLVTSEEPLRHAERAFLKSLNVCHEKLVFPYHSL